MTEKSKEAPRFKGKILLRLGTYMIRYKFLVFCAIFLTVSSNLLALVGPALAGEAINAIEPGKGAVDFQSVFYYCGLMLLFYAASSILSYILSVLMVTLSQKIVYQMRTEVFEKLASLPVNYYDTHQTGDLLSRLSYDIDVLNTSLSSDLLQICVSIITVAGSFIMMMKISPPIVLIFVVTIPISVVFTRYRAKNARRLFRARSEKLGQLNGFSEEVISGQKTTKAYHQESIMQNRFDSKNDQASQAYYDAEFYSCTTGPCVGLINNISLTLVSVFSALLYLAGKITLGNISSFVLYSRKFSGPINGISNIISELQSACAAAERIFRLLDEEPEPADEPDAIELKDVRGDVEMKGITFGYTPEKILMDGLNLNAPAGSTIAIVGKTGAGKTTLINLLMRFYDPQGGTITVDGKDIRHVTRRSLRQAYAMVLQDTWLFEGTIFENIAYGRPGASEEDVVAAAKAAHIDGYIRRLPDGYQTRINDNGVNISQGQKQLLTIARAMLSEAKMLILDEATSNVDTRTEIRIQAAMRELMKGRTCFVIAHRLSTIQHADRILVVQDGSVEEQGTHAELMKQNGIYAGLYQSQFR